MKVTESIVLESKSVRSEYISNVDGSQATEILSKASAPFKALWKQPFSVITNEALADLYEVPYQTIMSLIRSHRAEFGAAGYFCASGDKLALLKFNNAKVRQVFLHTPKSALLAGMLLRDSEVAKEVRRIMLNLVERVPEMATTQPHPEMDSFSTIEALLKDAGIDNRQLTCFKLDQLARTNPELVEVVKDAKRYIDDRNQKPLTCDEIGKLLTPQMNRYRVGDLLEMMGFMTPPVVTRSKHRRQLTLKGQNYAFGSDSHIRWNPAIVSILQYELDVRKAVV